MEQGQLEQTSKKLLQIEIPRTESTTHGSGFPGAARLKSLWRSVICRVGISRQRKALSVRETAALGDRRFVSVVQFERQRFLIGSSPSSVTLLAQLPDESGGEIPGEEL